MLEIVAAVVGLNFTIATAGIAILAKMDSISVAAIEYTTKKVQQGN